MEETFNEYPKELRPMTEQLQAWLDVGEREPMSRDDELRYGYRLEQLAMKADIMMPEDMLSDGV